MSIVTYSGLPGDGKSYSAVENFVIPALKAGRAVATNLQLNVPALNVVTERPCEQLVTMFPKDCTPEELMAACPHGAVIVVDEVWRYWPAGTKANEVPQDQLAFFKEHRHRVGPDGLATEILIIDQDPKTGIPAFLRALVELTYLHTKHSTIGAKGRFRVDVYNRCQSAEKPSKGALIRKLQGRYKPEVWNCYVSHTQSQRMGEAGLEKMVDERANLWKSTPVRAGMIALMCLPYLLYRSSHVFEDMARPKKPAAIPVVSPSRVEAQLPPVAPKASEASLGATAATATPPTTAATQEPVLAIDNGPHYSKRWRLAAIVVKKDGHGVAILRGATAMRRIEASACKPAGAPSDYTCDVDGELVTSWTGEAPFATAQLPDKALSANKS